MKGVNDYLWGVHRCMMSYITIHKTMKSDVPFFFVYVYNNAFVAVLEHYLFLQ